MDSHIWGGSDRLLDGGRKNPMISGNPSPNTMAALLAVLYLLFASVAYGHDYAKNLPSIPGKFVDLGTHKLHYRCEGTGQPTLVIDNGIAGSAAEWYRVQGLLAKHYRTCVYDRAGYVWSEPGPAPRTTKQIAGELKSLLENSGEAGPFVFVGHSFGGFTAMRMASLMAGDVLGVVLVDSSSPEVFFTAETQQQPIVNPIAAGAATGNDGVPTTPQEMARFLNSRRKALFVQMDEIANFELSASQVIDEQALRELPMLVVARDAAGDSGQSMEQVDRETEWRRAQLRITSLSSASRFALATGSDHFIHLRKPNWLANEIESFVTSLSSNGI